MQHAAIDVALADPTVESLTTMAQRVRRATRRHQHLIDSLLTLARSQRGIEHYDTVDLNQAVRTAISAATPYIEANILRVTQTLRAAPVPGDPVLLEHLTANLVDNASRHNTKGGSIDIHTTTHDATATLRIANSGPTIPPEVVHDLFEPFRRHAPDRANSNHGHGLGLSIVAAITAAHHGTYTAHPHPNGGLDITITLPTAPPTGRQITTDHRTTVTAHNG